LGGGASTGIELAAGRPVAIAINHDPGDLIYNEATGEVAIVKLKEEDYRV